MILYLVLTIPFVILGMVAQRRVTSTFQEWSQVRGQSGRTGAEVARAILDRNGLQDVEVLHTPGSLSDHYDPRTRTVNLSDNVFPSNSVAAVAVAAHEVGHAIQHQKAYAPLAIRSAFFPVASFGSSAFMPLFFVGIILASAGAALGPTVMLVAIALFALGVLFQLVTLPVEFDASRRAKVQLQELTLAPAGGQEGAGTSKVLSAAAMTYVAAALAGLAQLAYFVLQFVIPRN
ncbi:MAG: putative Zn-dependent protease [Thermoleophilia bacterium]|nr:putative Zn-dependent protease [Thermoleophilia bacterium]